MVNEGIFLYVFNLLKILTKFHNIPCMCTYLRLSFATLRNKLIFYKFQYVVIIGLKPCWSHSPVQRRPVSALVTHGVDHWLLHVQQVFRSGYVAPFDPHRLHSSWRNYKLQIILLSNSANRKFPDRLGCYLSYPPAQQRLAIGNARRFPYSCCSW